ncbi:MAG: diadenylate cyclase CdaA [Candidatus Omnitrophica bacterium]|nr:diadenylate cyclase CdaA [Candidatus Omnitrophota bacterium]MDD5653638.1 diadenylate cyclase CdaA [Candidatus Omnitrophota bacterium]
MPDIAILWKPIVEILILWFAIYHLMLFFEGSRAVLVLRGIIILLISFLLFQRLGFEILNWLMTKLLGISVIAVLIIFHPEIRQGLARLGQRHLFVSALREEQIDYILNQVAKAVEYLSRNKVGALIAIENNDSLSAYIESGVVVDAKVSSELIQTIFTPNSLLHDGALIIQQGRIVAAGCIFPLSDKQELSRIFGTRHRAALGLSEETDSLIIVVSEERQDISLIYKGKLLKDLSKEDLVFKSKELLSVKGAKHA